MTDEERASQTSAMFDGELPPAECELLARRLARDESLRRQWSGYALIGAAVRGEPIAARGPGGDVAARVRDALARQDGAAGTAGAADEGDATGAAAEAARRRHPRLPRWAVPLSGAGLAAGVAAAAIFWLRAEPPAAATVANVVSAVRPAPPEVVIPAPLTPAPGTVLPAPAPSAPAEGAAAPAADSYTVPPPPQGAPALAGGATLANYLVAHSEVSMPMLRRNSLSTVVVEPVEPEPPPVSAKVEGSEGQ